jgi:hypothetical protein
MSPVKAEDNIGWLGRGNTVLLVFEKAAQGGDGALETTVDQALIRGLGTAFRVCVSGLSSFLESGRRVEPAT